MKTIYAFKLSEDGFPELKDKTPEEAKSFIREYIAAKIFDQEDGRFRYTLQRNAEIIVLLWDKCAAGHFEINGKWVAPTAADEAAFPPVKAVYKVRSSTRYDQHVPIRHEGSKKQEPPDPRPFVRIEASVHGCARVTEEQFAAIFELAKGRETFRNPSLESQSVPDDRLWGQIRHRLRQSKFRKQLLKVYDEQCVVTMCDAEDALEAAHISPYSGEESNDRVSNGLLLRADIHCLFDDALLGINPDDLKISLHPRLLKDSSHYCHLHGRVLKLPEDVNMEGLQKRWTEHREKLKRDRA